MQLLVLIYSLLLLKTELVKGTVVHTYDLATQIPSRFVCMFSVSWFGLDRSDPQGAGTDASSGHWNVGSQGACVAAAQPDQCGSDGQREISSNYRPLAGIYSSSGLDNESLARIDLMLTLLIKEGQCDHGHAQLNAWSIQLESIQLSSRYIVDPSVNVEIPYQAYLNFRQQSQILKFPSGVIIPGYDSTWLYSFSNSLGFGLCDNSNSSNPRDACLNSTIADFIDIISDISLNSNYLINGKPLIFIYTSIGGNLLTANEWSYVWSNVRQRVTLDFYTICTTPSLLSMFDGVAPWIDLVAWSMTNSALPLYNRTLSWLNLVYDPILSSNISSGRIIMGGLTPGFDDFTQSWGACQPRNIPRHPDLMRAQLDYFSSNSIQHLFIYTWDDWTEGSQCEPDVTNGTQILLLLRQSITSFYGATQNTKGDTMLNSRWVNYPQLRNCTAINVTSIPSVDMSCPTTNCANYLYSYSTMILLLSCQTIFKIPYGA
ncbi:unnamed protein product [Rotaria socialis]|uniref:Uncharacterized protein n=1 Tax=Rotaria socialis TaxID=392032 RepID=A0A818ZCG2_9BILA|nr:unnamed protein product [Rotaria socialis]CAF3389801.1 unnamed protein product [Rotaria socialis]CAF3713816.1 unnamed protein product [Rotaria socialis]CAF3765181.1 unnamed protein product [Rotaria socialis]CAF3768053.1 unnamed protein product [Rotaria socialis]